MTAQTVAMLPDRSLPVTRMSAPERSHNVAIDGLRALAVLAVVLFHTNATWLPGGFTGVDLFFVVSGFVISQSLASRTPASLGAMLLDFYRRRVLRLLPALLVMLVATFILSALFIPRAWRNEQFDQTGWAALVGFSNIVLAGQQDDYFSPGAELNPFLHTWTLGVEEQFYLVFPLLFFVWLRGRERWPWSRWLLPGLTVLSLAWAGWQAQTAPAAAFYLLPARFWELAAGALLYQWMRTRTPGQNGGAVAAAGLTLLAAGVVIARSWRCRCRVCWPPWPVPCCCWQACRRRGHRASPARWAAHRWPTWAGCPIRCTCGIGRCWCCCAGPTACTVPRCGCTRCCCWRYQLRRITSSSVRCAVRRRCCAGTGQGAGDGVAGGGAVWCGCLGHRGVPRAGLAERYP